ncbi:MAG: GMC family oxidoreductase [Spirosomataceae bacterium]
MKNSSWLITPAEKKLKSYLIFFCLFYVAAFIFYLYPSIADVPPFLEGLQFLQEPFFANNSGFKAGLCIVTAFLGMADIRRFDRMAKLIIVGFGIGLLGSFVLVWLLKQNNTYLIFGKPFTMKAILLGSSGFDILVIGVLAYLLGKAQKERFGLKYLSPMQFRVAQALAEVIFPEQEIRINPSEVAQNLDTYLHSFGGTNKRITKLVLSGMQLYPLLKLRPPLSYMHPADRLAFLKRRFQDAHFQNLPKFLHFYKEIIRAAIRMAKQLCYMGYYNDTRVHSSIGYVPFEKRSNLKDRLQTFPIKTPLKGDTLTVMTEATFDADKEYDVVVIGSGAGASLMAQGLLEQGRKVLLVEKGGYEKPSEFVSDEITMISKLFADGALQLSRDFKFQVIQGSCVGGSTTVNNAVCFDTPKHIMTQWANSVGIDLNIYRAKLQRVNQIAGTHTVGGNPTMTNESLLNPCFHLFKKGINALGIGNDPNHYSAVAANVEGCLGCGYCNIGCGFGKKLSMLDNVLPTLQAKYPGMLEIVAGCEAVKLIQSGNRVMELQGKFKSKKVRIKGGTFVVAGGAVNSSVLLQKSKIGPMAGQKLCFNVGSQMTAVFPDVINAYDGLQISHYLQSAGKRYIMETWYNPPMFQSTAMPGWFEDHFQNMQAYNRIACTGVLVPSDTNGSVKTPWLSLTGRDIQYEPTDQDFNDLREGLWMAAKIYLAAGAEKVMPNTFHYFEYTQAEYKANPAGLEQRFKAEVTKDELAIGTGHPQGGNRLSKQPEDGVIGPDFKVFGTSNLYVADASVFPSALGVNPQITVMAMAYYASDFVAHN